MTNSTLRPAGPDDKSGIDTVIRAAFGADEVAHGDHVGDLWMDVRRAGHVLAEVVAVIEDEVVGHVGVSHCWLDARQELVNVSMLSPLSTSPECQSSGIGSALVAAAIDAARDVGRPLLFLEGSPRFYGSRGFTRASALGFESPSRRTPDAAFQVVVFDSWADWMTGRLIYPDAWWRHDSAGLRGAQADPDRHGHILHEARRVRV